MNFPGLGPTVSELNLAEHNVKAIDKTQFSMCVPPVIDNLRANNVRGLTLNMY